MDALAIAEPDLQRNKRDLYDLSTFFAAAQNADTKTKLTISTSCVISIESLIRANLVLSCLEMGCFVRERWCRVVFVVMTNHLLRELRQKRTTNVSEKSIHQGLGHLLVKSILPDGAHKGK
jgi:hypothetical protein